MISSAIATLVGLVTSFAGSSLIGLVSGYLGELLVVPRLAQAHKVAKGLRMARNVHKSLHGKAMTGEQEKQARSAIELDGQRRRAPWGKP